jgi:hypothetical protein
LLTRVWEIVSASDCTLAGVPLNACVIEEPALHRPIVFLVIQQAEMPCQPSQSLDKTMRIARSFSWGGMSELNADSQDTI